MSASKVGDVVHYFDKIHVAILELTDELAVGDTLKFVRAGEVLFEQGIDSMQIEHEQVERAEKGQSVGVKTAEKVKEGAEAFKVA